MWRACVRACAVGGRVCVCRRSTSPLTPPLPSPPPLLEMETAPCSASRNVLIAGCNASHNLLAFEAKPALSASASVSTVSSPFWSTRSARPSASLKPPPRALLISPAPIPPPRSPWPTKTTARAAWPAAPAGPTCHCPPPDPFQRGHYYPHSRVVRVTGICGGARVG